MVVSATGAVAVGGDTVAGAVGASTVCAGGPAAAVSAPGGWLFADRKSVV